MKSESLPVPSGEEFLLTYSLENVLGIQPVDSAGKKEVFSKRVGNDENLSR